MKMVLYIILTVAPLFFACKKQNRSPDDLIIFCASSLTDVISEIASEFEKENHVRVKLNFASSGTLARQIEHGAKPAIFISANKKWLDYLNGLNLTVPESEKYIAGNSLVLIAPAQSFLKPFHFTSEINLTDMFDGRLSIGDPQHVPAGIYAVQTLVSLGLKQELEPRFLPAKDVRSALMVVELGEVQAGIVYKTDALKSGKVKIITEFPDSLHSPVNYLMTMVKGQKNINSVNLYNYIVSEKSVSIWKKYGFKF
jgi:molybdate transport system substrate-binding protein